MAVLFKTLVFCAALCSLCLAIGSDNEDQEEKEGHYVQNEKNFVCCISIQLVQLQESKMELSKQSKTRKPNWSESELHALTQGVSENINIIRGKFGPSLTSETKNKCWLKIRECVNSVNPSAVQRDMAEVKKKWQDIQSIAKKKEAARVKSARSTGGGPPPEDFSKPWEQVVIGTLTKSMVEGIEGGEDTSITDRIINSGLDSRQLTCAPSSSWSASRQD